MTPSLPFSFNPLARVTLPPCKQALSTVRFVKLDFNPIGQFCFHSSHALGSIVDFANFNPSKHEACNPIVLDDVQNMCALTKVGILKIYFQYIASGSNSVLYRNTVKAHTLRIVMNAYAIVNYFLLLEILQNSLFFANQR